MGAVHGFSDLDDGFGGYLCLCGKWRWGLNGCIGDPTTHPPAPRVREPEPESEQEAGT